MNEEQKKGLEIFELFRYHLLVRYLVEVGTVSMRDVLGKMRLPEEVRIFVASMDGIERSVLRQDQIEKLMASLLNVPASDYRANLDLVMKQLTEKASVIESDLAAMATVSCLEEDEHVD